MIIYLLRDCFFKLVTRVNIKKLIPDHYINFTSKIYVIPLKNTKTFGNVLAADLIKTKITAHIHYQNPNLRK